MSRWADYAIVAANDSNASQISIVKRRPCLEGTLSEEETIETRTDIVASLRSGKTYVTARRYGSEWVKGADIHRITVDGTDFIRTDRNETKADNLGNLPKV